MKNVGKINKEWHQTHKMPANPTLGQRIAWHQDHARNCGCRPLPPALAAEIEKRKAANKE